MTSYRKLKDILVEAGWLWTWETSLCISSQKILENITVTSPYIVKIITTFIIPVDLESLWCLGEEYEKRIKNRNAKDEIYQSYLTEATRVAEEQAAIRQSVLGKK